MTTDTKKKIECPYCLTVFNHNGKPELQVCPVCKAQLLT